MPDSAALKDIFLTGISIVLGLVLSLLVYLIVIMFIGEGGGYLGILQLVSWIILSVLTKRRFIPMFLHMFSKDK